MPSLEGQDLRGMTEATVWYGSCSCTLYTVSLLRAQFERALNSLNLSVRAQLTQDALRAQLTQVTPRTQVPLRAQLTQFERARSTHAI